MTSPQAIGPQTGSGLPHDIRGLVEPKGSNAFALCLVLLAVALAAAIVGMYLWRKRRHPKAAGASDTDPWLSLERRLNRLGLTGDFNKDAQQEFFYELSMLLREAIELRTQVRATDLTLQELRAPLRQRLPLSAADVEAVLDLMERADLIKFAEQESSLEEARIARQRLATWLQGLKPAPEPALPATIAAARTGVSRHE